MGVVEEARELRSDPRLLTALQLQQNVLFGGEVEVERAVSDARGGHDGADLGCGHAGALELRDGRTQDALARLKPARFARRRLDLWRHGASVVAQSLT